MSEQGWHFDTDGKFSEGSARPRPTGYTWEEFENQEKPPCPTCGAPLAFDAIEGKRASRGFFIPGRSRCLRGCV
jgi:hypothetical protein